MISDKLPEQYIKEAEDKLETAFLLMGYEQMRQKVECIGDDDVEMPDSLEDALENGWHELKQGIHQIAKRERFRWHATSCLGQLVNRL